VYDLVTEAGRRYAQPAPRGSLRDRAWPAAVLLFLQSSWIVGLPAAQSSPCPGAVRGSSVDLPGRRSLPRPAVVAQKRPPPDSVFTRNSGSPCVADEADKAGRAALHDAVPARAPAVPRPSSRFRAARGPAGVPASRFAGPVDLARGPPSPA
jgi:hypothetical protein